MKKGFFALVCLSALILAPACGCCKDGKSKKTVTKGYKKATPVRVIK